MSLLRWDLELREHNIRTFMHMLYTSENLTGPWRDISHEKEHG